MNMTVSWDRRAGTRPTAYLDPDRDPKTGFPTESMAKVPPRNIAADVMGEPPISHKEFDETAAVRLEEP